MAGVLKYWGECLRCGVNVCGVCLVAVGRCASGGWRVEVGGGVSVAVTFVVRCAHVVVGLG